MLKLGKHDSSLMFKYHQNSAARAHTLFDTFVVCGCYATQTTKIAVIN